jgi:hypothetical protein
LVHCPSDPAGCERDAAALLAFKASGNGEGLDTWIEGSDPCGGWEGVTCGGSGAVTQLSINGLLGNPSGLTGDVGQLAALTQLTRMVAYSTQISGDVGQLAALTQLTYLHLQSTQVSGDVGTLAALTRLTYLSVRNTAVTGDIMPLQALTQLRNLYLSTTQVSGDAGTLQGLTQLIDLWLYNTAVTGCPLRLANGKTCDCCGSGDCSMQRDASLA